MKNVTIVGAGLVGSLLAVILAKRGYRVDVFERRPDIRKASLVGGRSINLALSNRGWKGIELAGLREEIQKIAIPMFDRLMHDTKGQLTRQPYGLEGEAINSVSRGELNKKLLLLADEFEQVNFHFDHKCLDVNLESNTLFFEHNGKEIERKCDLIIGTDGAFSAVRNRLQKTDRFNYSQTYLSHGYKELNIEGADGQHQLEKHVLHIWPRGHYMLIALPNLDGSFTCTLFFPYEGNPSFESIKSEADVKAFFEAQFPDIIPYMPDYVEQFFANPTASLVTVRCEPWNFGSKILMIGDASHAIVPFYGQGMNSGFEDCFVLNQFLDQYQDQWDLAIPAFALHRKPDADAISELALRNFVEMRDLVADEGFLLRKKIEKRIFERHPDKWIPLYSMVTFSDLRYSEALSKGKVQDKIMEEVMTLPNIAQKWDSDEVERLVLSKL